MALLVGVGAFLVILNFLCLYTYCKVSAPASKLRKEAARYNEYKKQFASIPAFMNTSEIRELRTMVNIYHVEVAQKLGVRDIINEKDISSAVKDGKLVQLKETRFWRIKELNDSVPYVTPDTLKLLQMIGERFHENLRKNNLPVYRFTISSVLRTTDNQNRLSRKNRNATRSISSHQFGTSVDILFREFEYTGNNTSEFNFLKYYGWKKELMKCEYDELGIVYARCLKTILGRTLLELQREGRCYVIYEIRQPVFHVTVAMKI